MHAAELPKGLQGFFSSEPGPARSTSSAGGASLWAGTAPHSMGSPAQASYPRDTVRKELITQATPLVSSPSAMLGS